MKPALLSALLLLSIGGLSQTATTNTVYNNGAAACGGWDSVFSRKGTWKRPYEDDIVFPDKTFPRRRFNLLLVRLDSLHALVRSCFADLHGYEPRWQRSIRGDAYLPKGPVPYSYGSLYFNYYCNTNVNRILLSGETANTVKIFINRLHHFFAKVADWKLDDSGKSKTVYRLPVKWGQWKGKTVYKGELYAGVPMRVVTKMVVLGRGGRLPWRSLTQKEYLTGLKNETLVALQPVGNGRPLNIRENQQRLAFINGYLDTASARTLLQSVVIDPKVGIWGFKGRFGNEDEGGFRLVLPALGQQYFDVQRPRDVPQLIQVLWSYEENDPVALHLIRQFEQAFPLAKLAAFIDN